MEAMRTTHPDLTMADLKGLLNDQGVPTVAAGFDQTGATVIGSARVGGELFRDPLTGQWTIDASSRYVGPVVRPGVEPATVTRWVRNAAETLSSALRMTILAKDAERPTITHGALVAGTGTGELDRDYGPLAGPKKVKDRERDGVALDQVRLNPCGTDWRTSSRPCSSAPRASGTTPSTRTGRSVSAATRCCPS